MIVTVVGSVVGSSHHPLALPSTRTGSPSDPVVGARRPAGLYPSPSTTQHPVGHGDTSTVRQVRDVSSDLAVGAVLASGGRRAIGLGENHLVDVEARRGAGST